MSDISPSERLNAGGEALSVERAASLMADAAYEEVRAERDRLRAALWQLAWDVQSEAEHHRFGTPGYDMTLDHLWEQAETAKAALDPSHAASAEGAGQDG